MSATTVVKSYAVEAFLCDPSTGTNIAPSTTYSQGSLVSACVRPDAEARNDGVVMDRIDSFTWKKVDTGVEQPAVVDGSVDANILSEYFCAADNSYCSVTSILLAEFFGTAGSVEGLGSAYLGFGDDAENPVLSEFSVFIGARKNTIPGALTIVDAEYEHEQKQKQKHETEL
eukprot:jgi/Psemu1/288357/fgenesh1_pg.256_\